jgi:hypothetical protein
MVYNDYSTPEGCLAAVQQNGYLLMYVPHEKNTPEICIAAVQRHGCALQFVPDEKITPEICLAAVKKNGLALNYVPDDKKTHEMCLLAVQSSGYMLKFIPEYLQTDEIVTKAIENFPEAVQYIKKTIKIHHGIAKQMPEKAYDTLEMGYDEETAIQDGELMVDFHNEFEYGRFYRKKTFDDMVLPSKKNPTTREAITEYTIYQAKV